MIRGVGSVAKATSYPASRDGVADFQDEPEGGELISVDDDISDPVAPRRFFFLEAAEGDRLLVEIDARLLTGGDRDEV